DRNRLRAEAVLGDELSRIGQRGCAGRREIQPRDPVRPRAVVGRELLRPVELDAVPLSVVEGERVNVESFLAGDEHRRGGIETARQADDRLLHRPGISPQRILCSWSPRRIFLPLSRIQSARSDEESDSQTGENVTTFFESRSFSRTKSRAQSKSLRSARTNLS